MNAFLAPGVPSARYTLALLNPVRLMIAGTVSPAPRRSLISLTLYSVSSRFRPNFTPRSSACLRLCGFAHVATTKAKSRQSTCLFSPPNVNLQNLKPASRTGCPYFHASGPRRRAFGPSQVLPAALGVAAGLTGFAVSTNQNNEEPFSQSSDNQYPSAAGQDSAPKGSVEILRWQYERTEPFGEHGP